MTYGRYFSTRKTSQSDPIPGREQDMAQNNAGGFAFPVDDWVRLDRFLILGTEGGTYYINERALTIENAQAVMRCIRKDGQEVVNRTVNVSISGRAPKNDPALFVLAMCAGEGDKNTRTAALDALPQVARIGTHLFHFLEYCKAFRGWGRGLREAVARWYNDKEPGRLAYQAVKYRQRDGWTHRDALRLAHPLAPTGEHDSLYHWITQSEVREECPRLVQAFLLAQEAQEADTIVRLIADEGLTREMIPTQFLAEAKVWDALLQNMPMTAMVRNLGKMTNVGLVKSLSNASMIIAERLRDAERIRKARVHPLSILVALRTYQRGRGIRGGLSWEPVAAIVDALDDAFYLAFGNVEPMGKRVMLALDVSGSMTSALSGMPLSAREGSAAMALVTARTEPAHMFTIFSSGGVNFMQTSSGLWRSDGMSSIDISPRQRLDDVIRRISGLPFGGTDCALPMIYAMENKLELDVFIIYTDSETWAGAVHPVQALAQYRRHYNPQAKLVVVGMTSNGFSIADPNDGGMLDVVGFDTATPNVIADFGRVS